MNWVFANVIKLLISLQISLSPVLANTQKISEEAPRPEKFEAYQSNQINENHTEAPLLREVLVNLGFDDLSSQLRDRAKFISDKDLQLEMMSEAYRYEISTLERELAIFVLSRTLPKIKTETRLASDLIELTTRSLTTQPWAVVSLFPKEIDNIPDEKERISRKASYVLQTLEQSMNESKLDVISAIMATVYGKQNLISILRDQPTSEKAETIRQEIDSLDYHVKRIVELKFTDFKLNHSKFFGRALLAGLLGYEKLGGRLYSDVTETQESMEQINKLNLSNRLYIDAASKGVSLGNFSTENLTFSDKEGKPQSVKLETGDVIMGYSGTREAFEASSALVPSGVRNLFRGFREHFIGLYIFRYLMIDEQLLHAKISRGDKPTLIERLKLWFTQTRLANRGYSKVGFVEIKKDPKTGLAMSWVYDAHHEKDAKSFMRLAPSEQFIADSAGVRVGVLKNDSEKLFEIAKRETGNGQTEGRNAKTWYETFIAPKVISNLRDMIIAPDNYLGMTQSTDTDLRIGAKPIASAFENALGFSPIINKARLSSFIKIAQLLRIKPSFDVASAPISASSFAWQPYTDLKIQVEFQRQSAAARFLGYFGVKRFHLSGDGKEYIRNMVNEDGLPTLRRIEIRNTENTHKAISLYLRASDSPEAVSAGFRKAIANSNQDLKVETSAAATIENKVSQTEKQMREFLMEIGFQDDTKIMKDYLQNGKYNHEYNKIQIERNIRSYEAKDQARELAILFMNQVQDRLGSAKDLALITDFTAKLLTLKPYPQPNRFPPEIENIGLESRSLLNEKELEKLEEKIRMAKINYLVKLRDEAMKRHTSEVTSDFLHIIFGEQSRNPSFLKDNIQIISRIQSMVSVILERNYRDHQTGQTNFLGRAITALLARHAELEERSNPDYMNTRIMRDLALRMNQRGDFLENYIGETIKYRDESDAIKSIKIHNGTRIGTRLLKQESAIISSLAVPHELKYAKELGLVGNVLIPAISLSMMYGSEEKYSLINELASHVAQLKSKINDGISHIGFAYVLKANNSKISMSYALDNYPHNSADDDLSLPDKVKRNPGGMRLVGMETFVHSKHSKVVFMNFDYAHFGKFIREQWKKEGYPKDGVVFHSFALELDSAGDPIAPKRGKQKHDHWKIKNSKEDLERLFSIQDNERLGRIANDMIMHELMDMVRRGVYFQWVTPLGIYINESTYCSQAIEMAAKRVLGVSIMSGPDNFPNIVRVIADFGDFLEKKGYKKLANSGAILAARQLKNRYGNDPATNGVNGMIHIITPSGIMAQSAYSHPHHKFEVDFKNLSLQKIAALNSNAYQVYSPSTLRAFNIALPSTDPRVYRQGRSHDLTENIGKGAEDIENIENKNKTLGIKIATWTKQLGSAFAEYLTEKFGKKTQISSGEKIEKSEEVTKNPRSSKPVRALRCEKVLQAS